MRRAAVVLGVALACSACKSVDAGQAAAAAITVGAAVAAAAINRAATDECWGSCPSGTICDSESGLCLPITEFAPEQAEDQARWYRCDPERFACDPDEWLVCDEIRCEWYRCNAEKARCDPSRAPYCGTDEDCAPSLRERLATAAEPPPFHRPLADPCRGLCLAGERCQVTDGIADCVMDASP